MSSDRSPESYRRPAMPLPSSKPLDAVLSFSEIVPDTVIFDDFDSFPPNAVTVSSSLLLGIYSLPVTKFKSAVETALANSECYGQEDANGRMACFFNKAFVNVGADLARLVLSRVSTEVDARLAYDTQGIAHKIRKYSDNRFVKTEDMEKLINCSSVQSYMLNRAHAVFLKARSPNRKKGKSQNEAQSNKKRGRSLKQNFQNCEKICASCPRTLKEDFDYCSINCMVKQVLKTEGNIVRHLRRFPPLPLNPVEADEDIVAADLILRDPATTGSMINGSRRGDGLKGNKKNNEEPSPCALVPMHIRKGVPKRSPFC